MSSPELAAEAFERRYHGGRDPWSFAKSTYELNRYTTVLSSLRMAQYGTVYEPGCSIGVLTEQLAGIAQRVIASDFAPSAIDQAKLRCAQHSNVHLVCTDVRTFLPEMPLDLIVFSEIGYYFSTQVLTQLVDALVTQLVPGGEFVAAHWLGKSPDHVLHGDQVHEVVRDNEYLVPLKSARYPEFRLDTWIRS